MTLLLEGLIPSFQRNGSACCDIFYTVLSFNQLVMLHIFKLYLTNQPPWRELKCVQLSLLCIWGIHETFSLSHFPSFSPYNLFQPLFSPTGCIFVLFCLKCFFIQVNIFPVFSLDSSKLLLTSKLETKLEKDCYFLYIYIKRFMFKMFVWCSNMFFFSIHILRFFISNYLMFLFAYFQRKATMIPKILSQSVH